MNGFLPALHRRITRLAATLAFGLVVPLLPASAAVALDPIHAVSLSGATSVTIQIPMTYEGRVTTIVGGLGAPLVDVQVLIDGVVKATRQTAVDGAFSAPLTFTTYGSHNVQAVAGPGSLLEARSPVVHVVAVPPSDPVTDTDLFESTTFIHQGPEAPQQGVAPGTIEPAKVSVIRGAVTLSSGAPLSGVTVTVPGRPEYGNTLTRADGGLDLAVNGGEPLTVRYVKTGYLPVERAVTPDRRDYAVLPTVVMTPLDSAMSTVSSGSPMFQVARGSTVNDSDGTRRATVLFPPNTTATAKLPNGTTSALNTLHVHATEFTVGTTGPAAMPGDLPATTGYTYAVDWTVDEAANLGATTVTFNHPVVSYVENFLDLPVGVSVPYGYYDYGKHAWLPEPDGRVVAVVSITLGKANLDVTGDGVADTGSALTALGVTDAERSTLATLYSAGQSLWRVPVAHFTPGDKNQAVGAPIDAVPPQLQKPLVPTVQCTRIGSIVGCERQTLGERIPVTGTPYSLRYDTSRVPGYRWGDSLRIPLTGSVVPASMLRVELSVTVAGRRIASTHSATPNQIHTFTWDGLDGYGRQVHGEQTAHVSIGWVYEGVYYATSTQYQASFATIGSVPMSENRSRDEITFYQRYEVQIGRLQAAAMQGIGGWTLSDHHAYDPDARTLYLGSGEMERADTAFQSVVGFAGTGAAGASGDGTYTGDGGAATAAGLGAVRGVAVAGDGTVFLADTSNGVVRRVDPNGVITRFAGGGSPASGNGDNGPATSAELVNPVDVAVAADGGVFVLDSGAGRVRHVDTAGVIRTVAGGGNPASGIGDGGPATAASLATPQGIAVGADGALFIADTQHNRVRHVSPGGLITTYAGGGTPTSGVGDGLPAPQASLNHPLDVAVTKDGRVYVSDSDNHRVRMVLPTGLISTVAGNGLAGATGDDGTATEALVGYPEGLTVDANDGSLYVAQRLYHRVRRVSVDGVVTTAAGTGVAGTTGDGGPAARARLNQPRSVAVGPDGTLYLADSGSFRVRRVVVPLPGFTASDLLVVSRDGSMAFRFDAKGRHLSTVDTLTGEALRTFGYDTVGRLATIDDEWGNRTTVEYTSGVPTAIVGPFGQRTNLEVDGSGNLTRIANPAGEAATMTYLTGGLLDTFTTPRDETSDFGYDSLGRLVTDLSPDGASITLSRADTATSATVTATTAEGRATSYRTSVLDGGARQRVVTDPSGAATTTTINSDGTVSIAYPDGSVARGTHGPDPRWGMQAPIVTSTTLTLRSGLTSTTSRSRTATLSDAANPLSMTSLTDVHTVGGRTTTTVYTAATRTADVTSPGGRHRVVVLGPKSEVVSDRDGTLDAVGYSYDDEGRLQAVTQGTGSDTRTTTFTFGADGLVDSVSDPLHTYGFTRDLAGRITSVAYPDGKHVDLRYDDDGNPAGVTPPARAEHVFGYTEADRVSTYTPAPATGTGTDGTSLTYNDDRQLTHLDIPEGRSVDLGYDSAGRLGTVDFSRGRVTLGYDETTAQVDSLTAPGGESLSYDFDGDLLKSIGSGGTSAASVAYTYDSALRPASVAINGSTVSLGYDLDDGVTSAAGMTQTWNAGVHVPAGSSVGVVSTTQGHNTFGEQSSRVLSVSGTPQLSDTYDRDKLGRITNRTEVVAGVTTVTEYGYDDRDRLADVTVDGTLVRHYAYDDNGNRTAVTGTSPAVSATYDGRDRVATYDGYTYTYTPYGELASRQGQAGTSTYTYDELGNLVHAGLPGGTSIDYQIDALGRRVGKKTNGALAARYVYGAGPELLAQLNGSGAVIATFVYAGTSPTPELVVKGASKYRIFTDHLGSPRLVVDTATGAVVQRMDFDEFGNVTLDTNPGFQPFGFAGGLYDPDTKLTRFGVRDYDATTGRFTARDPLSFSGGSANLYSYADNDPINFVDPTGETIVPVPPPPGPIPPIDWELHLEGTTITCSLVINTDADGDGKPDKEWPTAGHGDQLPRSGERIYVPPKDSRGMPKPVRGGGFEDKDGYIWTWDKSGHRGPHWDVTPPRGSGHENVFPDGRIA